jgi:hypothetical protein
MRPFWAECPRLPMTPAEAQRETVIRIRREPAAADRAWFHGDESQQQPVNLSRKIAPHARARGVQPESGCTGRLSREVGARQPKEEETGGRRAEQCHGRPDR